MNFRKKEHLFGLFRVELYIPERSFYTRCNIKLQASISRDELTARLVEAQDEAYLSEGSFCSAVRMVSLFNVGWVPINGAKKVRKGDVVWMDWYHFKSLAEMPEGIIELRKMLHNYKPLWEKGPGYEAARMAAYNNAS